MSKELNGYLKNLVDKWWVWDAERILGIDSTNFKNHMMETLRRKFDEEVRSGNVPPPFNSSNIIPCALVMPESAVALDRQFNFFNFQTNGVVM